MTDDAYEWGMALSMVNHELEGALYSSLFRIVICCGWNSGGFGKKLGFEMIEILLVPHGRKHNDTIVMVERKLPTLFDEVNSL